MGSRNEEGGATAKAAAEAQRRATYAEGVLKGAVRST